MCLVSCSSVYRPALFTGRVPEVGRTPGSKIPVLGCCDLLAAPLNGNVGYRCAALREKVLDNTETRREATLQADRSADGFRRKQSGPNGSIVDGLGLSHNVLEARQQLDGVWPQLSRRVIDGGLEPS